MFPVPCSPAPQTGRVDEARAGVAGSLPLIFPLPRDFPCEGESRLSRRNPQKPTECKINNASLAFGNARRMRSSFSPRFNFIFQAQ